MELADERGSEAGKDRWRVHLLGDLRLSLGPSVISVTAPTHRRFLCRLAVASGATVSVGTLIDTVWPEDSLAQPKESLQSLVHRLRRIVGPAVIRSTSTGYRLEAALVEVDLDELTALARQAINEPDHQRFQTHFASEIELMSNEVLPGISDEPWAIAVAQRVAEERAIIGERQVRSLIALGRRSEAVIAAEHLSATMPDRESAIVVLIEALSSAGREAEALRVAAAFRSAHVDRTGLRPSPRLANAEQRAIKALDLENSGDRHRSNIPVPITPYIGRAGELVMLDQLVRDERMVTVWGPGGIGKTRLALAAAEHLAAQYEIVFADLSEAPNGERVPQVIGAACGAGADASIDAIVRHLDEPDTILLLDNAEHVVVSVTKVLSKLLTKCRHLRVLVTSRERLDVPGEVTFEVPPLGLQGPELFVLRATAARRDLRLDEVSAPIVSAICDRLDGLPLAIELAAAQVAWRSLPSILEAVCAPLDALGEPDPSGPLGGRINATIDWSWGLLSREERAVLGRVSVFAGPFQLEALRAVTEDVPAVADHLATLVKKSMVAVVDERGAEVRYRLLDTVRSFVRGRLAATGDDIVARVALMRWAAREFDVILGHTRAGRDEAAAELRMRHGPNLAGAIDTALAHAMTDEVMGCLPAIAEIGWRSVVGSADRVAAMPGSDVHPANPYLWLLRGIDLRNLERVREAAAVIEAAGLPIYLCAKVRAIAVQAAALVGADHRDDLAVIREMASADHHPLTAWAHAFGELWALPLRDPQARVWSSHAATVARSAGMPAAAAIADYLGMQSDTGPENAREYRRLRTEFARFGMHFYVELCETALFYSDLGSRPVDWWLARTRIADRDSPGSVCHFGEHRARLLAHHGAPAVAATILGGLDRLRAEGLDVTPYGSLDDRAAVVASNAAAYERGRALGLDRLGAFVVDELARLAAG